VTGRADAGIILQEKARPDSSLQIRFRKFKRRNCLPDRFGYDFAGIIFSQNVIFCLLLAELEFFIFSQNMNDLLLLAKDNYGGISRKNF
jgi:hypothetical protein